MTTLLPALHGVQAALSAYGLYIAYHSITNLHKYEEKSEKAAKYSNTAAHQLHKTRTTQASGTVAILASLATSTYLIFSAHPTPTLLALNVANAAATLAARIHLQNFWKGKAKVPFVEGYNDAISQTGAIMQQLAVLTGVWALSAGLTLAGLVL
ncbi:hypothetical protein H2201_001685 [Coniosporium apollinis]|uniref:Uncharacterized protein n=2 Tax=Coniosporium TaxID=2810619 RepID=A0ABQ9P100_9PEZI|nr:hypothetical protein H2199_007573 [Cladosporium sp. JES 115]KAJ9668255.1 hypothetical protein H2201_001685 [Coniosporium apollinis]